MRLAEDATRAGMVMSLRRMVAVVALARPVPVILAPARVRLNAMTARTSQAGFAVNFPEDRSQVRTGTLPGHGSWRPFTTSASASS